MTSFWIGLLIGFALASFLWWGVFISAYRRVIRRKMAEIEYLKQAHRAMFAELIHRMNHEGVIPNGTSSIGLLNLISLVISTSIDGLGKMWIQKGWDTSEITTDLQEIAMVAVEKLRKTFTDFIESRRSILRDYDKHQGL